MSKFKNLMSKIILVFAMALMLGVLDHNNVYAADQYSDNLIPKMSGYTNGNITVSEDAYYTDGAYGNPHEAWKAFDRSNVYPNYCQCNANPLPAEGSHWIKVDFDTPKCISKITITCIANDLSVKNFKLQGSNDNKNWSDIYQGININTIPQNQNSCLIMKTLIDIIEF